jgi:hypothetical protein
LPRTRGSVVMIRKRGVPFRSKQVGVARVRALGIPERVNCEIEHRSCMLLVTVFKQRERLVLLPQARADHAGPIEIDIKRVPINRGHDRASR